MVMLIITKLYKPCRITEFKKYIFVHSYLSNYIFCKKNLDTTKDVLGDSSFLIFANYDPELCHANLS